MSQITDGCLQVRSLAVHSYALLEPGGVILIDGGFLGGIGRIERELSAAGRGFEDVRAILLTHGHLDHTLNLSRLRDLTDAPIHAPRIDERHIAGRYPYRGLSRICGLAEAIGRKVLRYRVPEIDHWFGGGDFLDVWDGLRVVSLPGHTFGHCGFYSEKWKLLFAGDLFSNYLRFTKRPPPWFCVDYPGIAESIAAADALDLSGGVLLNHGSADASPREIEPI